MAPGTFCTRMRPSILLFISGLLSLMAAGSCYGELPLVQSVELFVATTGSDRNPGTKAQPFASLERARDEIRRLNQSGKPPHGAVTVQLRGGNYYLPKTFELTDKDSGTEDAPVVYRQYGTETVRLIGGRETGGFGPVTDAAILARLPVEARGKVMQSNLKSQGINDFGSMTPRGYHQQDQPAGLELFFGNRPMELAGWPKRDWADIKASRFEKDRWILTYEGDRPQRWLQCDDVWLHGYWSEDWADSYVRVLAIDPVRREITTQVPPDLLKSQPTMDYYALNILDELDEPGEWYLDRKTGILYFLPPAPMVQELPIVSTIPTVVSLRDARNVTFIGITFEVCRDTAVTISGGTHNRLIGCTIRNTGNDAVRIKGGTDNGVVSCDIYHTGAGGIHLEGGNRADLTPAGNFADNNHIHDYSRWRRTYHPAVGLFGVGNRATHNLIHDAPHTGIMFAGNEHLVEFNEIHHVGLETGDVGAIYTYFQDWTQRGTVIRYNFLHDLKGTLRQPVISVYLDDASSGTTVSGNIFFRDQLGVMIGGGRDNTVANNIFLECETWVLADGRGATHARKDFGFKGKMRLFEKLKAVGHDHPPYSTRYPRLAGILDDDPTLPKGNVLARNIYSAESLAKLDDIAGERVMQEENFTAEMSWFADPGKSDFRLKEGSPPFRYGFTAISPEKIGLYKDTYRIDLQAGVP